MGSEMCIRDRPLYELRAAMARPEGHTGGSSAYRGQGQGHDDGRSAGVSAHPGRGAGQGQQAEETGDAVEGGGRGSAGTAGQPRTGGVQPVRDADPATHGTDQERGTRRTDTGSTPVVDDSSRPEGRRG